MNRVMKFKDTFISSILISSSLVLYIILFSTAEIYFNNLGEFNYSYSEIFLYLIAISFLFVFLVTSILLITPNRLFKIISSVLLAIILLSWIEGYVLYPDYGPLDGRIIDWDNWLTWGYIDILIWIIALSVSGYLNVYILKYLGPPPAKRNQGSDVAARAEMVARSAGRAQIVPRRALTIVNRA